MRYHVLILLLLVGCNRWENYLDERFGETTFVDNHGIEVSSNGYPVDPEEFEETVSDVLLAWQHAFDQEGVGCNVQTTVDGYIVSWTTLPFYDERYPDYALAGSTEWVGPLVASTVGFREPLTTTALGHEIGHNILTRCGQPWDHETMLYYSDRYGTPY
jgi:hypothetical protein